MAWGTCLIALFGTVIVMMPDFAYATSDTPMSAVLCTAASWFTGSTGKGLATIAITIIGIGALLGKVSWGMAIIVGMGVAIVFGAGSLVTTLSTSAGNAAVGCGGGVPVVPVNPNNT